MVAREVRCRVGEVLLVKGPAMVKALDEGFSSIGVSLGIGDPVVIRINKVLPIEADRSDAVVMITPGDGGGYQLSEGRVGTRAWNMVRERVFSGERGRERVVVIGKNDSGKSTLTAYLINIALSLNLRVGVVDGDLGQGDLAPPGSIGGALVKRRIFDLRELRGEYISFVGVTSPQRVEDVVIREVRRVQMKLEKNGLDFCVVNTDGYVRDGGVKYKVELVRQVDPDLVICMRGGDGNALFKRMLDEFGEVKVIPADGPEEVVKKPQERIGRRLSQYQRFLRERRNERVNLKRVALSFLGTRYAENVYDAQAAPWMEGVFAKKDQRGDRLILRPGPRDDVEVSADGLRTTCLGSLAGMFVGLGSSEWVLGFGLVVKCYPNGVLNVATPVKGAFDTLHLGVICLSRDLKSECVIPLLLK